MSRPYIDTSALAKWYLHEPGSDEVDAFLTEYDEADIARLGVVEFRCLLARRRRNRSIGAAVEKEIYRLFEQDIRSGHLIVRSVEDRHFGIALSLIERVRTPLRTLDALHLAIAQDLKPEILLTADQALAKAARQLGFRVQEFG